MTRRKPEPTPEQQQPAPEPAAPPVVALVRDTARNGAPLVMTPDGIELARRWASSGASNNWISARLGIARDTLRELRRRQPALDDALAAGRAIDEHEVASVLRAKAMTGDTIAMLFYLKARHGWKEGTDPSVPATPSRCCST